MTRPMASLPMAIVRYSNTPYPEWVSLAWTGAMLITVGVLALNILSRFSHAAVSGKQGG
jgi:phosphate transport system permease protein